MSIGIVQIAVGGLLLLLGRRLFWFFVAGVGFIAGMMLADLLLAEEAFWLQIAVAIGLGLAGAVFAYFLQKLAIGLAGFLAGAFIGFQVFETVGNLEGWLGLVFVFGGGVLGAVLLLVLFDWALILLSSILGAHLVVEGLVLEPRHHWILFAALCLGGIVMQAMLFLRKR